MKRFLYLLILVFMVLGISTSSFAKEEYTALKDPKNSDGKQDELQEELVRQNQGYYIYLRSDSTEFNGMDYESFKYGDRGEDYLVVEGGEGGYAIKGTLTFIPFLDGRYSKVKHQGLDIQNYSKTLISSEYKCEECGKTFSMELYKAYDEKSFKNVKDYVGSDWCEHALSYYSSLIERYEEETIKESGKSKVKYYVYGGMPVDIPAFSLVTSINPSNKDLWVAVATPETETGKRYYNAGVFQVFDSTSAHIKHVATPLTSAESQLLHTVEVFQDVEELSVKGEMYYEHQAITNSVNRFFLACNNCSTCERCIIEDYGEINAYVAYGEIPEFYMSRGCPLHACCFVYDYPVVLPDEYEGIKCPDLKLEGDKYPACEEHTCKRWLEHSDYRENFAPQTCLKVVSGRVITDTGSGVKEIRYTGPVDEGLNVIWGQLTVIDGGYSKYCANHTCNSFFCNTSREDSESYASKYNKQKNLVTMPNKYCSGHKSGCRVVCNYLEQPKEIKEDPDGVGETMIEQIEKDRRELRYNFCNSTVTQSFYAFFQPDTMICEGCYKLMEKNKLNYSSPTKNFDIGKCPNCGDQGVNIFLGFDGKWCITCIDFHKYEVVHRNIKEYEYSNVRGTQRDNKCEFNIQRFAGDDTSLCGERCVEGKRYCYWHLCDKDDCSNPVKYNGSYFCEECVPYIK